MTMVRFFLIAILAFTFSGCGSTARAITSAQLAEIFADRRKQGAMVGMSETASSQYAVEFATPSSPTPGAQYRYETFTIRKKDLDPILRLKIEAVAIKPGVAESTPPPAAQ